jgi:hypothetical protein
MPNTVMDEGVLEHSKHTVETTNNRRDAVVWVIGQDNTPAMTDTQCSHTTSHTTTIHGRHGPDNQCKFEEYDEDSGQRQYTRRGTYKHTYVRMYETRAVRQLPRNTQIYAV